MNLAAIIPESGAEAGAFFLPNEHLLGLVKYAASAEVQSRISLGSLGEVVVYPQNRGYTARVPDWSVFCRSRAAAFQVAPGLGPTADGHGAERDIGELLWIAAFHLSDGRLPVGSSKYDVIKLRHWPNLSRLPSSTAVMQLCALLARRPSALHLARKLLNVGEADAYRFYSAALASGAVELVSRAPAQNDADRGPAPPPPAEPIAERASKNSEQSLLRNLWNKIAGL